MHNQNNPLTARHRIGYALGDLGGCMTFGVMGGFMTRYFVNVAMIDTAVLAILTLIWKICDALCNPAIGMAMDKSFASGSSKKGTQDSEVFPILRPLSYFPEFTDGRAHQGPGRLYFVTGDTWDWGCSSLLTNVHIDAILCISYIYNLPRYHMDIILSNSSGEPIYQQIVTQIKGHIMSGALAAGDALPSMRLLAQQLRISVITTKRAYEELERDGFIENFTGRGCFVRQQNPEFLREETIRQTEEHLRKACEKARLGGLTLKEMQEMLELMYGGDTDA